jgi:hypothetical protein
MRLVKVFLFRGTNVMVLEIVSLNKMGGFTQNSAILC